MDQPHAERGVQTASLFGAKAALDLLDLLNTLDLLDLLDLLGLLALESMVLDRIKVPSLTSSFTEPAKCTPTAAPPAAAAIGALGAEPLVSAF